MSIKIAFYKARYGTPTDKLIAIGTFSEYSHCEIIFSDGMFASASPRDGGVRFKKIDIDEHWDVFELTHQDWSSFTEYEEELISRWFILHEGDSYDWIGAIGAVLNLDFSSKSKKYCSYCCAVVLSLDPITTPGKLYKTLLERGMISHKI